MYVEVHVDWGRVLEAGKAGELREGGGGIGWVRVWRMRSLMGTMLMMTCHMMI